MYKQNSRESQVRGWGFLPLKESIRKGFLEEVPLEPGTSQYFRRKKNRTAAAQPQENAGVLNRVQLD